MKLPDKNIRCPATAFSRSCHSIVTKCQCPKFVHVQGMNRQTGQEMDHWGCVDTILPYLTIECSNQMRECGAAIETLRNTMHRTNEINREGIAGVMQVAVQAIDTARAIVPPLALEHKHDA